jgi:outer membrane protein assembly factor BamA
LKYDFETGLTYGVRWREKNFRGRVEQLELTITRNERNDENFSFGWSAPWIGWKHISVGAGVAYFNRGDEPIEMSVLEQLGLSGFIGFPLTESRIKFSQFFVSGTLDKKRTGALGEETDKELSFSPRIGYRFDSRNSGVRPTAGRVFGVSMSATYPLNDGREVYYLFQNDIRHFREVTEKSVIALLSNFAYQFGDYPDYSLLRLGGPSSLRGYARSQFKGFHRWFGTIEWRYEFLPRFVFPVPIVNEFDIGLGLVTFLDSGITWNDGDEFTLENFRGTGGVGLRLYSPIRDVIRFDFGVSPHGSYRFSLASGIRF